MCSQLREDGPPELCSHSVAAHPLSANDAPERARGSHLTLLVTCAVSTCGGALGPPQVLLIDMLSLGGFPG
jgi:hypothetical protein